jgi:hypothetical protein
MTLHPCNNRRASISKIPKRTHKPDTCKQSLCLFQCVPSPFRLQLVFVPAVSKLPALLGRERRAPLDVAGLAPTINVLFCTEDEHCASGEADVVPPMVRRNGEVNDSLAALQLPGCDLQQHRLATVAASRSDDGVRAQRRHNAERVPNTDAPVRFSTSFNPEW